MNSEELEQSLKAEFENYLKQVIAEMRDDVTEFQIKIESEFEKHKSHIDEAFNGFSARFDSEHTFDEGFRESVVEHMRLARDEGAKITATAITNAEEMERLATPEFNLADIKEAVIDISSKDSQSAILKALIQHAASFTPRGAFFIIKGDHFVGWKVFGKEAGNGENAVRDIHFPVAADSILGNSVRGQSMSEGWFGTYTEDNSFLEPLEFGQPDRMYAIPLVARGRGVAVLYADYGHEGVAVNTDALEMLVRVAGLTVEMLASAKAARYGSEPAAVAEVADDNHENESVHSESSFDAVPVVASPFYESADAHSENADIAADQAEVVAENEATHPPAFGYDSEPYRSEENVADMYPEADVETKHIPETPVSEYSAVVETAEGEITDNEIVEAETPEVENVYEVNVDTEIVDDERVDAENVDTDSDHADHAVADATDDTPAESKDFETPEFLRSESVQFETVSSITETHTEIVDSSSITVETAEIHTAEVEHVIESESFAAYEPAVDHSPVVETAFDHFNVEKETSDEAEAPYTAPTVQFDTPTVSEPAVSFNDVSPFDRPIEKFEPATAIGAIPASNLTPVVEKVSLPIGSRLSDRNVDLPIEVADDERRYHNDARRFARLLVSEIKLYNEKRVQEGREAHDLYERLREAIDRSREMYDKRVQPPVASKFDYFHYELVSSLAEGDIGRLGGSYPGATV